MAEAVAVRILLKGSPVPGRIRTLPLLGFAVIEPLDHSAAVVAQEGHMLLCLNSFGDYLQVQPFGKVDDGPRYLGNVRVDFDIFYKGAVDLQRGDWKAVEVAQVGIAGTEVVDGDVNEAGPVCPRFRQRRP